MKGRERWCAFVCRSSRLSERFLKVSTKSAPQRAGKNPHTEERSYSSRSETAQRPGPSPISSSFEGICLRTRSKISITSERRFTGRKFERCTSNFSPLAAYSERSSSGFLFLTYTSQLTEL